MGYYTQYSLKQVRNAISDTELASLIAEDEYACVALDLDGDSKLPVKWYEHEECLCAWSAQYPNIVFRLHAEGEDSDGIWDKYFTGGKLVHTESFKGLPEIDIECLEK